MITSTIVGYGDVHLKTILGQILGAVVAVVGIGLFALPASLLASGFIEIARSRTVACPHYGEEILEENLRELLE